MAARLAPTVSAQTLALAYTKLYGLPLCRRGRHVVAWYGDMDLASHAWRLLGLGPLDAHIRIGPPVPLELVPRPQGARPLCRGQSPQGRHGVAARRVKRTTDQNAIGPAEVPGIHQLASGMKKIVDGRDKPGHDEVYFSTELRN